MWADGLARSLNSRILVPFSEIVITMDGDSGQWEAVVDLINSEAGISEIRDALAKLSKEQIEDTYDKSGMNLMHLAVLNNRKDIVVELYENMFHVPHCCATFPYLHMATALGYLPLVTVMVRTEAPSVRVSSRNEHWKSFIDANVGMYLLFHIY